MNQTYQTILETIRSYQADSVCLAFSGGVDSTLVLKACIDAGVRVYPVIFKTSLHPVNELSDSRKITDSLGAELSVIVLNEFDVPEIMENKPDRCYVCKKTLFTMLRQHADQIGCSVIMDGTNFDDLSQYRPGLKALEELLIRSPLAEAKVTKKEVRGICGEFGMEVSSKPSTPCLATRLPYYTKITEEALKMIDQGESYLKSLGFTQVRVRKHDNIARIEILPAEFGNAIRLFEEISKTIKGFGFDYITLDLEGFRSGSMDINL